MVVRQLPSRHLWIFRPTSPFYQDSALISPQPLKMQAHPNSALLPCRQQFWVSPLANGHRRLSENGVDTAGTLPSTRRAVLPLSLGFLCRNTGSSLMRLRLPVGRNQLIVDVCLVLERKRVKIRGSLGFTYQLPSCDSRALGTARHVKPAAFRVAERGCRRHWRWAATLTCFRPSAIRLLSDRPTRPGRWRPKKSSTNKAGASSGICFAFLRHLPCDNLFLPRPPPNPNPPPRRALGIPPIPIHSAQFLKMLSRNSTRAAQVRPPVPFSSRPAQWLEQSPPSLSSKNSREPLS